MSDEKDRLGGKLRDVEKAREDQWARQHDAELVEKMKKRLDQTACPQCKKFLVDKTTSGVTMRACPDGHGAWIEETVLKVLLKSQK